MLHPERAGHVEHLQQRAEPAHCYRHAVPPELRAPPPSRTQSAGAAARRSGPLLSRSPHESVHDCVDRLTMQEEPVPQDSFAHRARVFGNPPTWLVSNCADDLQPQ